MKSAPSWKAGDSFPSPLAAAARCVRSTRSSSSKVRVHAQTNSGPRLRFHEDRGEGGTWYIHWSERGRSRERTTGTSISGEAEDALTDFLNERKRKAGGARDPAAVFVTDLLADYAEEVGPKAQDPERIKHAVKALTPFWTGKVLTQITPQRCEKYANKRGRANDTIRRELGVLGTAINHAHTERRLTHPISVPLPPKSGPRDVWLTRSEVAIFLWAARKQRMPRSAPGPYRPIPLQLFILIGVYTGRRKEAILSRQWAHVNFREATLDFRRADGVETKKRRGRAPLNRKLLGHLRRASAQHGTDLGYIIEKNGARILDIKRSFATTVERAGLPENVTPHALKHTAAMWMKLAGVPIQKASEALATSIETLEKVYQSHEDMAYMRDAVEAI